MNRKEKGITLVDMIVTIVIMLILAGVAINLTIRDNGIFKKSEQSVGIHNKEEATEKVNLKITYTQMRVYTESQRMPTLQEIANDFCEDEEVQYVELESKRVASINKVEIGEAKSFFTKLKKYPYEFEINSSLQLASIDGVKVADSNQDEKYETLLKRIESLEEQLNNRNQATGVRTDTYIQETLQASTVFSDKTSMSGLTRVVDENNNIAEYLSFSETDGYTVLKEGWYFVTLSGETVGNGLPTDLYLQLVLNNYGLFHTRVWQTQKDAPNRGDDATSIYLKKGDKIYFKAWAGGGNPKSVNLKALIRPMF